MAENSEIDEMLVRGLADILGGEAADWDRLISDFLVKGGVTDLRTAEQVLERLRTEVRDLSSALGNTRSAYDAQRVGAKLNGRASLLKSLEAALNQRLASAQH
jgi:hypothetical protein